MKHKLYILYSKFRKTHPFAIFLWSDEGVPVRLFSFPTVSAKIILRNEPVGWISNHIYHCRLAHTMFGKIEDKVMFEEKKGFLKYFRVNNLRKWSHFIPLLSLGQIWPAAFPNRSDHSEFGPVQLLRSWIYFFLTKF